MFKNKYEADNSRFGEQVHRDLLHLSDSLSA